MKRALTLSLIIVGILGSIIVTHREYKLAKLQGCELALRGAFGLDDKTWNESKIRADAWCEKAFIAYDN